MICSSVYRLLFIVRPPVGQLSGKSLTCCGYLFGEKVNGSLIITPSDRMNAWEYWRTESIGRNWKPLV